ncbi:MAG: glycosyltransferase family 39 protein [Planctomycetaceae bacterium]
MNESVDPSSIDLRSIATLAILTVLLLIPFSDKAMHIDDPFYVWVAQQIHVKPLDFFGFETFWTGAVAPAWWHNKNPPGTSYFIAMASAVFGWSERALHLAFLLPAVGAVVGSYVLAKRMCSSPFMAAVTSLLTPVFLISGTQIMCESLLLCSWVWSVVFWVDGIDRKHLVPLLASAGMVALACLIKYPGINLIPLLFTYAIFRLQSDRLVDDRIADSPRSLCLRHVHGQPVRTGPLHQRDGLRVGQPGTKILCQRFDRVGVSRRMRRSRLFYLPWLCSGRQLLAFVFVTLVAIAVTPRLGSLKGHALMTDEGAIWSTAIPLGLFACGGGLILILATRDLWKHRDSESLLLWLWVGEVFVFAGFVNWSVNGRSATTTGPRYGNPAGASNY